MKTSATTQPPSSDQTLLDRMRQAGLADALLVEMDRQKRQRRRKRVAVRSAAAAALLVVVAFWAVPFVRDAKTVATVAAQRQTLALADGSQAELNARTDLKTDFRYGRRHIQLTQGEAFFAVAKDAAHPFIVETPGGSIRVTGTQFNVRLAPDDRIEVTLIEGSVEVTPLTPAGAPAATPVLLNPDQQVTVAAQLAAVRTLSPIEIESVLAWRDGRILLDGSTLGEAVARFAAYHGATIAVDPAAAALRLGGGYALDDLSRFLRALEATQAVEVLARGDGTYRIIPVP